jgi:hypothetical protein
MWVYVDDTVGVCKITCILFLAELNNSPTWKTSETCGHFEIHPPFTHSSHDEVMITFIQIYPHYIHILRLFKPFIIVLPWFSQIFPHIFHPDLWIIFVSSPPSPLAESPAAADLKKQHAELKAPISCLVTFMEVSIHGKYQNGWFINGKTHSNGWFGGTPWLWNPPLWRFPKMQSTQNHPQLDDFSIETGFSDPACWETIL